MLIRLSIVSHNKVNPTMFAESYIKHHCIRNANGCWEWQRSTDKRGYGIMKHRYLGKDWMYTHRAMWTCLNGTIPEGMILLHSCDNPKCCNVEHLSLGTHKDNTADMLAKGRQKSKLKDKDVLLIKETLKFIDRYNQEKNIKDGKISVTYAKIAECFNVSTATIKLIHKGKTWKHIS